MEIPGAFATAHLYRPLHERLIQLLEGLAPEDWQKPTICRAWAVRDIVAHLLDVDIRHLSLFRDHHDLPAPDPPISGYSDLVAFLNRLNAGWVTAARCMSPRMLIDFLRLTGPQVSEHVAHLDMSAPARFSVAWAGEEVSANWFDVARNYSERWHHQQQIRDAVGATAITSAELLSPVLEAFLRALPHAYRDLRAKPGESVAIQITGEAGGSWTLSPTATGWQLDPTMKDNATARLTLDDDTAWRHFTKGLTPEQSRARIQTEGPAHLTDPFLTCLAIMA